MTDWGKLISINALYWATGLGGGDLFLRGRGEGGKYASTTEKSSLKTYLVYAGNQHVGWRPANSNAIIKIVFFKSCGLHVAQLQLFVLNIFYYGPRYGRFDCTYVQQILNPRRPLSLLVAEVAGKREILKMNCGYRNPQNNWCAACVWPNIRQNKLHYFPLFSIVSISDLQW